MRVHIEGAISDLHAADGRYHVECMSTFINKRSVKYAEACSSCTTQDELDNAFCEVTAVVSEDLSRMWNTIELFQLNQSKGGQMLTKRQIVDQLVDHFGDNILVLSSPGVSSIVVFRNKVSTPLKLVPSDDDSDLDMSIKNVGKQIVREVKVLQSDKGHYNIRICNETAAESACDTILALLAKISPNLDRTLPAILIGNIITSLLTNSFTTLQIALGVLMKDSKDLVNHFYDFGVTCSYDEIFRFKKYVTLAATTQSSLSGISDNHTGLGQAISGNFFLKWKCIYAFLSSPLGTATN